MLKIPIFIENNPQKSLSRNKFYSRKFRKQNKAKPFYKGTI